MRINLNKMEELIIMYIIYEFSNDKEEVIEKYVITGVTCFESAKRAAALMAGRELGFCMIEER